eukprot:TRINITY_DN16475_c1_g2_i1.p2 TRINITY_DN16475_c1_g2~~TRINITY_DN16475_c1_g2_i1.p2  ORF type:complete len:101 (+),score=13.44 TRINITY_DN16475_c1_g2_i1:111-413(+)
MVLLLLSDGGVGVCVCGWLWLVFGIVVGGVVVVGVAVVVVAVVVAVAAVMESDRQPMIQMILFLLLVIATVTIKMATKNPLSKPFSARALSAADVSRRSQ